MNLKAGYPFSLIKNGLVTEYPRLEQDTRADVVIMGGGISGALTAWHLIKENINCIVVDARTIGLGSTCASTSLLQYEIDTPLYRLAEMIGIKKAARSYHLCNEAIGKLITIAGTIGFTDIEKKKSLYYAAAKKDVKDLKNECKVRKEQGFAVRWLEENNLSDLIGIRSPGAILSDDAAQTDAYMFTHALYSDGLKKGLQVYDRTNITRIDHKKKSVELFTRDGYSIKAKKLIYATGYEVVNYIDKPVVKLRSTYATISEPLTIEKPFWKNEMLIWNTADPYLYIRAMGNRVVVGGRDEDFYSPAKRDKLLRIKTRQLTADLRKVLPGVPFIPEFSWTGTFGSTKDGLPYIGNYKQLPNSYFALGFGGNG
ncbi:MAG TPA: FAD-binding oxidoreductase, partial [Chitinophagaceae bacterium]|nr:FAD-binding oxidoreductase [Chitinophagaceae bacterium]